MYVVAPSLLGADFTVLGKQVHAVVFPAENEAGRIFAEFRNGIAHGEPPEIEKIHCVLFEVARALIYIMILKNAGIDENNIKYIAKKLF